MANILWFKDIKKEDLPLVGGKGANLGEMFHIMPIPDGFCVTVDAYNIFLETTGIKNEIFSILKKTNIEETEQLDKASERIRSLIIKSPISKEIQKEIASNYNRLNCAVAVRSSATAEDLPPERFAGQQDTYLNVKGEKDVINAVRRCWASLFTSRAIYYRETNKFKHDQVFISVVIQEMVDSEVSGVAFSVHPVTQDKNQLIIEAAYGLGEAIVSGQITPDSYVVDKKELSIVDISISNQERAIVQKDKGTEWKKVKGEKQKLSGKQIIDLSRLIIKIEQHYGFPVDIEWAFKDKLYILQSRPITTLD